MLKSLFSILSFNIIHFFGTFLFFSLVCEDLMLIDSFSELYCYARAVLVSRVYASRPLFNVASRTVLSDGCLFTNIDCVMFS